MTEFSTGDDTIIEVIVFSFIAIFLVTDPNYQAMVPFPTWLTFFATYGVAMLIPIISRGRLFWATVGGIAWVLLKLKIVKEDRKEYTVEYDEDTSSYKLKEKEDDP